MTAWSGLTDDSELPSMVIAISSPSIGSMHEPYEMNRPKSGPEMCGEIREKCLPAFLATIFQQG
jgi:hypothetical protein